MSKTRCRPRMLSHVINIHSIAPHSTHAALQLPQSPLLPCRRNISFPANSYPLRRRKFHLLFIVLLPVISSEGKSSSNKPKFCSAFVLIVMLANGFQMYKSNPNVLLVWRNHNRQAAINPVPPNEHYLF